MTSPIIIGVDPGTTCAWAILNTRGDVLEVYSSKELDLGGLLLKVKKYGLPVLVGTDKEQSPEFVRQFSIKTGAKLMFPKTDMSVEEKRELTKYYSTQNTHERDALASAISAFNKHQSLFRKIKKFVESKNKKELEARICFLVLTKGLSVAKAFSVLEETNKEIESVKRNIKEKEPHSTKLLEKYSSVAEENSILRAEVEKLEKKLKHEKNEKLKLNEILRQDTFKSQTKEGNEIKNLKNKVRSIENEKENLEKELAKLNEFLEEIENFIVCKRINKLSKEDFKNINIKEEEVFYIEDISSFSPAVLEQLKKKKAKIIAKKAPKPVKAEIMVLDPGNLEINLTREFAFVKKENFFKAINKSNLIEKLVEEYKSQRENEKIWNSP